MSVLALALTLLLGALLGASGALALERLRRGRALQRRARVSRIAFPFTAQGLSEPALVAALRLARAESATLVPVYLALVPLRLAVEVPLREESELALGLLEAVEQRALRAEVPVDSRIERGRTVRHALRELIAHERFERIVVAVSADQRGGGFSPEDVAWLMRRAPGELIALRPARTIGKEAASVRGDRAAALSPRAAAPSRPRRPLEASPELGLTEPSPASDSNR